MIKPKKISRGDTIALLAPSGGLGGLFPHRVDSAKRALEKLGFKVKEFPTARKFQDGKAGTPDERIKDLHDAFSDPSIKAIMCTIGGLCSNEIIGRLDYELIKKNPKMFCGYSDISILHHAIARRTGLVTFYGPAAMTQFGEFPEPLPYTVEHFLKATTSTKPVGTIKPSEKWTDETSLDWSKKLDLTRPRNLYENEGHIWLKEGKATAPIIGGCLSSIMQLKGTPYDFDSTGKILFVETCEGQDFTKGEPLGYADAHIMDLRNAGVFDKIKGLVVGRPFGYSAEDRKKFVDIIAKHVASYNFPVLVNVNVGHADPIITIPLGVTVTLDSAQNRFSIDESGVSE
ncbi:LD-carboxypeptidase [Candidatus Woesearchaeota archaeon]|nr:LD-carboxypeptidase [Candidatus Woesearchaeota archaeon]